MTAHSPRFKIGVIVSLIALSLAEVATNAFVIGESHTTARLDKQQGQICKLVKDIADSTARGIDTNKQLIVKDTRDGSKSALADAAIRRKNVRQATPFLKEIQKAEC